ncbi:hypothetical protein [Streptomyces sp. NRRL F-5123]|uniref:hypothetical protein n=1 Tax=Streptomyces sp. NRRL F-5123 TaxID=1463856 RepID=UPI0004E1C734|nr:hypothetical protein [Streptomyces sp. NRRL F-5123]
MADFEFPEDFTALNDEELTEALAGSVEAFDAKSQSTCISAKGLECPRTLAAGIESICAQQAARHQAAAAEIDAWSRRSAGAGPSRLSNLKE